MIQDYIPPNIDLHALADDHGLKNHFNIGDTVLEQNTILDLENCVCDVNSWMKKNRLKMNASKTDLSSSVPEKVFQKLTSAASTFAKTNHL